MNVLLVNQFYPPDDAPTGRYLHDLARMLAMRGHAVHVICSEGSYAGSGQYKNNQMINGVHVIRLPSFNLGRKSLVLKLADYALFYLMLAIQVIKIKFKVDVAIVLTTPPWVGLVIRILTSNLRCARIHWIMDLYPDVLFSSGMKIFNSYIVRKLLRQLTRQEFVRAKSIIAIGRMMENRIRAYTSGTTTISTIPLWSPIQPSDRVDNDLIHEFKMEQGIDAGNTVFLYSGNMGVGHAMQELMNLIQAHKKAHPADQTTWIFSGGGKKASMVQDMIRKSGTGDIRFLSAVDRGGLYRRLSSADVHIASMMPGWEGVMIPSKIQAIFGVGRPTLFLGTCESEAAEWIQGSKSGWVVDVDDAIAFEKAISDAKNLETRISYGENAYKFSQRNFDATMNLKKMIEIIERFEKSA